MQRGHASIHFPYHAPRIREQGAVDTPHGPEGRWIIVCECVYASRVHACAHPHHCFPRPAVNPATGKQQMGVLIAVLPEGELDVKAMDIRGSILSETVDDGRMTLRPEQIEQKAGV